MSSQPSVLADVRDELTAGIGRWNRRRRRQRRAIASVAAIGAMSLPLATTWPTGRPADAIAIERGPDVVSLRILDASADPAQMTRELQDAGLNATVEAVPASPSLVGRWAGIEQVPSAEDDRAAQDDYEAAMRTDREGARRLQEIEFGPDVVRVPISRLRDIVGTLRFQTGREPRPGEAYAITASAFAPGEPLHCSGIERLTPVAAADAVRNRGFEVLWAPSDTGHGGQARVESGALTNAQLADSYSPVPTAEARNPKQVVLYTTNSTPGPVGGIPKQDC